MKIGFVITARLKSTRLPEKVLLKVNNRELLAWMIDRAKLSSLVDEIIISTSTNPQDDRLCELAEREGIECFRGDEDDVLNRLYCTAKKFDLDFIINGIADSPLFSFDYTSEILDSLINKKANVVVMYNIPIGLGLFGIDVKALKKANKEKKTKKTQYIDDFFDNIYNLDMKYMRDYHITIDYPEDYELFKKLFEVFGNDTYKLRTCDLIEYLDEHPEVAYINKNRNQEREERWKEKK